MWFLHLCFWFCETPLDVGLSASSPALHSCTTRQTRSFRADTQRPKIKGSSVKAQKTEACTRGWRATHSNLIELSELQSAVAVDGRPQVLAVVTVFH